MISKRRNKLPKNLKEKCRKLNIRLTVKRKGKRVYKSEKELKRQCEKKSRGKKRKFLYNPNDPKKSFDVYIDKNPKDTIPIKYTSVKDVRDTIRKLERLYKTNKYPHTRIWKVGMILKVRLEAIVKNTGKKKEHFRYAKNYFHFLGQRTKKKGDARKKMVFKFNKTYRKSKFGTTLYRAANKQWTGDSFGGDRSNHGFSFFAVHPDDTKSYITDNPYYYKINFPKRDCGNIDKTFLRELKRLGIDTSKVFDKNGCRKSFDVNDDREFFKIMKINFPNIDCYYTTQCESSGSGSAHHHQEYVMYYPYDNTSVQELEHTDYATRQRIVSFLDKQRRLEDRQRNRRNRPNISIGRNLNSLFDSVDSDVLSDELF